MNDLRNRAREAQRERGFGIAVAECVACFLLAAGIVFLLAWIGMLA